MDSGKPPCPLRELPKEAEKLTRAAPPLDHAEGQESKSRVLDLTLRGVHHIRIDRVPGVEAALRLAVENVETGDKFARALAAQDLVLLVSEKLRADVESLDDLEYLLVEGLKAEQAAGDGDAVKAEDQQPLAILAASKESAADGQRAQRFTIRVRILKGIPGRHKEHTIEILVPVTAVATKDDAVSAPTTSCLVFCGSRAVLTCVRAGQIRIMFRKLKENFERTNADLRAELDLMRLQSNNRLLFGVAHSVSRFATALKTCTVATIQGDMFKPVPKTEVGTFRPVARAGSVLAVVPSGCSPHYSGQPDTSPKVFTQNWVQGQVDWTPEVRLTGDCFQTDEHGALVVKRVG
jgi:hypothetical protein